MMTRQISKQKEKKTMCNTDIAASKGSTGRKKKKLRIVTCDSERNQIFTDCSLRTFASVG
jgi:hypothetical protein